MIAIKPFEPTDETYRAYAATLQACWPEFDFPLELLRFWDENREANLFHRRFTLWWEELPAGYGTLYEPREGYRPGKYGLDIIVDPAYRRRGLAGAFYDFALTLLPDLDPAPQWLTAETREDQADGLAFLQNRGFEVAMRFPRSILDVAAFEPERFRPALERVAAAGIAIRPLADLLAADEDGLHKYWQLTEMTLMRDVPFAGEYRPRDFESFAKQVETHPNFRPELIFIALDGENMIGMSGLRPQGESHPMWLTGLTGVVRAYRRRGIALALKVVAISHAKAAGATLLETDNEENNPMYDLNLKLGFEPRPAWVEMEKLVADS